MVLEIVWGFYRMYYEGETKVFVSAGQYHQDLHPAPSDLGHASEKEKRGTLYDVRSQGNVLVYLCLNIIYVATCSKRRQQRLLSCCDINEIAVIIRMFKPGEQNFKAVFFLHGSRGNFGNTGFEYFYMSPRGQ